ncbi:hypothetical protein HMPREF1148_0780 [Selenomonas sp. FOBRC6]|uniref:hypothetical protein n=1 Tax=Selenomonas sp. FOBRC6 TaxID=936572 RepID=UPI0002781ED4|nr:hypothetical protein [Selenomonas sp. FOBRC6]EJO19216.1 hypothetical protein HMPREF1148_0780 [Selenomonas sp. FOBRC6]
MAKRPYGSTPSPAESIRERKKRELEQGLARVRKKRASYQRKIIGTALVFFIILIILCALMPSDDGANYDGKWNKDVNSRQAKILQSLQDNFK